MTSVGLVIGLLLGGIVTHLYDRKGFHRIQGAAALALAQEHQAQHKARRGKRAEPAATESTPAATESTPDVAEPESSSEQT
ncbi:hypothetical protein L842_5223 [Mycobacterium intracellulare MIN_052511_1280]|nr:hypothetical protein L842_5223 [Mycobacterium intracellulare MIN_052511_1280]